LIIENLSELLKRSIMKRFFLFISILIFAYNAKATHLIGGEIYYECLGNNTWVVGVTMYRDCYVLPGQGAASFDAALRISIYRDSDNQLLDSFSIYPSSIERELPLILNAPCLVDTPDICVSELEYRGTFILEIPPGGVHIVNQRCCRTDDALNLLAPSDEFGSTYYTFIPDSTVVQCNNSPRFNVVPPKVLCSGIDLDLDYSATDSDGDSLVYGWCDPYHGGGQAIGNGPNTPVPYIPTPPPFTSVVWSTGFSTQYQLPSAPQMTVNTSTGIISGRPNQVGTYVTGVCVQEYRDGILLNENRRDFQLTTTMCNIQANAAIDSTLEECIGLEVDFFNMSSSGQSFLWNFGDTAANDTSSVYNPSWTFSDTGTYTINLIAYGTVCNDTTSLDYEVLPRIEADFTHSDPDCLDRHKFEFIPGGYYKPSTEMQWRFGNDTNFVVSDDSGLNNIRFSNAGEYEIKLTYLDFGCEKVKVDTVEVWANPQLNLIDSNLSQCTPFNGKYSATTIDAYKPGFSWYLDSTLVSNNDSLRLITDSLCIDTVDIYAKNIINVLDTPIADFTLQEYEVNMFDNNMAPYFEVFDASNDALSLRYYLQDTLVTKQRDFEIVVPDTGTFHIHQVAIHANGCRDTNFQKFRLEPQYLIYIPNSFTPDGVGINETWFPKVYVENEFSLQIFDRWGQIIYQTAEKEEGWNGKHKNKGSECPIGVYTYQLNVIDNKGLAWYYDGTVTLVR
jgi:gliding motility-associated-like protein